MLKVFLVEDETVIREGLRDRIPWEQYGYRFVGEAADGEVALPLIRKTRPDVLITDIKMPFMDGLSLSRIVREEFPKTKILIISGYDDFEYAREAISIGVDQYILKPVTRMSLRKVLQELKEKIATLKPEDTHKYPLIQDLIKPLDLVILVVPIDKAAPKGRLILPQQQTIRDILERGALSLVVRDTELKSTLDYFLSHGVCPKMVVTDSQAFARVSKDVPENITLTSFSILFSRYKGELETQLEGVAALSSIQDDDRILIAEGCTHHRQCGDIGTCKIPDWIRNYTGKKPVFEFTSGTEFPDDVSSYKMVVHCGGCMLNEREMKYRCLLP